MQSLKYLLLISFFILTNFSNAQFGQEADVVSVKSYLSLDKLTSNSEAKFALKVKVEDKWHINSIKPNEDFLIPSEIKLISENGFTLTGVSFPEAKELKSGFSDKPLSVYEKGFFVTGLLKTPANVAPGNYKLVVEFAYQPCNDVTCLAPASIYDTLVVEVAGSNALLNEINSDIFSTLKIDYTKVKSETKVTEDGDFLGDTLEGSGLFLGIILIFLAGLALNLTPCVYPLIPITIGFFGGQSEGKTSRLALMGGLYVLGLAITYSAIGVITSLSGAIFGTLLQNTFVIIAIALIFVSLSLSMFGVYEFKMPDSLVAKAGGAKSGYYGAFFMGLTMGIVAAPCVGPFVISLVTFVAAKADPFLGFLLFFVLALGLGLPYFILAIFSGKIKQLPRAGAWMDSVKHIFGLIMLGMAIYFLLPLIPKEISGYLLPLFMIIAAVYLLFFDKSSVGNKGFQIFKNTLSVLILALAVYILIPSGSESIKWEKFSESAYSQALASKKPVILDFYADWCIPCKELDALTFTDPVVIKTASAFTTLKVDMTKSISPEVEALRNKFNIIGVPTVIILNSTGQEVSRITGFIPPEEFIKLLQKSE